MARRHLLTGLVLGLTLTGAAHAQETSEGTGAVLRVLDKITGIVRDVEIASGQSATVGNLTVALGDCRYPSGNVNGDAFAWLSVTDGEPAEQVFQGWMIASAPALNAMDHARYDVWALRCMTP